MATSVKTQLSKYLKEMTKQDLEKEVKKLYTKFKPVKDFYEMELSGDTTQLVKTAKDQIRKEYFPTRGYGKARSSVSRKVISDFKKIAIFQRDVIDLLLYRVEMMLDFTNEYGEITDAFYVSLESSFEEACKLIEKEKLQAEYKNACKMLVNEAKDFGWGVYEGLSGSFEDVYPEERDETFY